MSPAARTLLLSLGIGISLGMGAYSAHAAAPVRLFYYREGTLARKSFFAHPSSIDIFAPQSYALQGTGALVGSVDPALLTFAAKHHIKVMPLVTNDDFGQTAYQNLLDSSTTQAAAISSLVQEAKKQGYWGWQIDFEQMDASYRDKFSTFVQNLDTVLRANGLVLSVAVVAKISDMPIEYQGTLWQDLAGVYDYGALASSTDFVSVMAYDDPESKGPVAEYDWYQKVLAYSLAHIPAQKISLGIGLYYWQWNNAAGKRVGIGGNQGIENVIKKHKVSYYYSATEHEPYLVYWSHAQEFSIWYENARSLADKMALIKKEGLYGFSAWALGLELPSVYSVLQK